MITFLKYFLGAVCFFSLFIIIPKVEDFLKNTLKFKIKSQGDKNGALAIGCLFWLVFCAIISLIGQAFGIF